MAWVAVDKDGTEVIYNPEPYRDTVDFMWCIESDFYSGAIQLPKGTIKQLFGVELKWEDKPIKIDWNDHDTKPLQIETSL